ncbi:MAG TPA: O-methyltransferase [Edaphocola sp.]|nr:O-methyltransferase [Edaphocola sp.]
MQHTITPEPISEYAEQFSSPESILLKALNEKTHREIPGAQMLSGHLQGLFLQFISRMIRPERILEVGTYTGYSAICLAKGLAKGGILHTIDVDATLQEVRNEFWAREGLEQVVEQHIGPADKIIAELKGAFDLVFIDADKRNYGVYFDLVIDKVAPGGWILADNTLFHGEVVLPEEQRSKSAGFIHQFNRKVSADNRVEQVILPVRDGITIIRKK